MLINAVAGSLTNQNFLEIVLAATVTEENGTTRPFLNVYHLYRTLAVVPVPVKADVVNAFITLVDTTIAALLCDNFTAPVYTGRWLDDPLDPAEIIAGGAAGGVATDSLPSRVGVTIRLDSGLRGRNYRGSKHYGPIPEAATTRDNLTTGALASWNAVANLLSQTPTITDSNLNQWQLMILSQRLSNLVARPSIITGATVVTADTNARIGSMQRRRERLST